MNAAVFDRDASSRLELEERSREERADAVVRDVVYRDAEIGEVDAYLVTPGGGAARAGVLFLHWFDTEAPDGNRAQFLDESVDLAGRGVASLLPQGTFPWAGNPSDAEADIARIRTEVVRHRRGLDLLVNAAGADAERLALVGHDFGGMYAAILAAVDRRARAAVLIAAVPRWADWFLPFWPIAGDRFDYLRALAPYDPITHVANAAPAALLFQFARNDFYIAGMTGLELRRAASEPNDLKPYETDHAMRIPEARADRLNFLAEHLDI